MAFFLFVFIWLRATLPRIRYDQLMRFGWQVLLPLAVLNLLFTALAIALDWPWWVTGLFGLGIILIGVGDLVHAPALAARAASRQQGGRHAGAGATRLGAAGEDRGDAASDTERAGALN